MTKTPKSPQDDDSGQTPEPNLGGRPRFKINYESLKQLCSWQCTGEECAAVLGCCYDTLNENLKRDYADAIQTSNGVPPHGFADGFSDFFRQFSLAGKASLRQAQFREAIKKGNANLLKFLGKNYLDQTDQRHYTHSLKELQDQPTEYLKDRLRELEEKAKSRHKAELH